MKNEPFHTFVTIGFATITTATGREPVCVAFRGAFNDTLYLRPSQPLDLRQRAEALAQACNPDLIETAAPCDFTLPKIVEALKDKVLIASEVYEDLEFAHELRQFLKKYMIWSTLHPQDQIPSRTASASSAAESVHNQLRAVYTVCPTYENRMEHIVDKVLDNKGHCIGFSIAGPIAKRTFANIVPSDVANRADAHAYRQLARVFAADCILMACSHTRMKLVYATPEVRQLLDTALCETLPEGEKVETVADYEADHPLNPDNPHNRIAEFDPADYPGG